MNERERFLSFLGIARKAGKLSMGADEACKAMETGRVRLLLLAQGLSPRSERRMRAAAETSGVPAFCAGVQMDEIALAVGKRTGILAVTDGGFAEKLTTMLATADPAARA